MNDPYDERFVRTTTDFKVFRTRIPRFREGPLADVYAAWQADVAEGEQLKGGPLTKEELKTFADRPDPRPRHQIADARRKRHAEIHDPPPDTRSVEQRLVDSAAALVRDEQRARMTPAERSLADAQEKLAIRIKADEAVAAAAKIREMAGYRKLREELDRAIWLARFDTTISVERLEQLQHQSDVLEHKLDVATVRSNFDTLRTAILKNLEPERMALKTAQDQLALREAALKSSPWDDVNIEVIGNTEYVNVTVGDQVAKVSKARFDSTDHAELRDQLFPATTGDTTDE